MIKAQDFLKPLVQAGYDFFTGVPCSFLTPILNAVSSGKMVSGKPIDYVGATSEGEAVAIACGAALAGRLAVMMCQNSGLGNAVNPLTSLAYPFKIPFLMIVTWRGQPGINDEPQHALMGRAMPSLFQAMEIGSTPFPSHSEAVQRTLDKALAAIDESKRPYALVMQGGDIEAEPLRQKPYSKPPIGTLIDKRREGDLPLRQDVLATFIEFARQDWAVVATTGKCGRELFKLADRRQHFYQVGSMGCASAIGLGLALSAKPVIVFDGDGAALMKMGNMATVGGHQPKRYIHVLLDNTVHDSTGGQPVVAVDFAKIALACGYRMVYCCDSLEGWKDLLDDEVYQVAGPIFVYIRIRPGSMPKLGRPTMSPLMVAERFQKFLHSLA